METYNAVFEELCKLIDGYTRLSRAQISPNISFVEMGADSLVLVCIIQEIEKMYGVRINTSELEQLSNLGALVEYIIDNHKPESK